MNRVKPLEKSILVLPLLFVLGSQDQPQDPSVPAGGWVTSNREEYRIFVDRQVKYRGQASCSIKTLMPKPEKDTFLMQVINASEYKGKRLRMTAFVKTEDISSKPEDDGGVGLFITTNSIKKRNLTNDGMLTRKIVGTTDWTQYALVVDVPKMAKVITFGMKMRGPGQAWFDEFQFEVVGKDVPTTGGEVQPSDTGSKGSLRKDLPKKPQNPDFEQDQG